MRKLLIISILLSSVSYSQSYQEDYRDIMEVLKYVETENRPMKIGDAGKAYGVLQIHKIAVDDVNRIYKTKFTHEDAFNVNKAERMFYLYIRHGSRIYKLKNGKHPSEQDIVRMWNGGCYTGYLKKTTLPYYKRYTSVKNRFRKHHN